MATAWLDEERPELLIARGLGRPLWLGKGKHELFFASTRVSLELAESYCRIKLRKSELPEGTVVAVAGGRVRTRTNRSGGVQGGISNGEHIELRVPGTDRTFSPRVSGVVRNERMTWTGGVAPFFRGVRTFELRPRSDGSTDFAMTERFSGLLLPLVSGSLPDFGPVFETYANDLRREAERNLPLSAIG